MAILSLEECLAKSLITKRTFNRLKRIESGIIGAGAGTSLPEFLNDEYHNNKRNINDLTTDLKYLTQLSTGHGRLREYMVAMGIPILSRSDALRGERNPNYGNRGELNPLTGTSLSAELKTRLSEMSKGEKNPFYGKTHTEENRVIMSQATKGKTWEELNGEEKAKQRKEKLKKRQSGENSFFYGKKGSLSPTFGRTPPPGFYSSHGGIRRDLGHFVRSTWEANVARVFLLNGESYVYEPQRFLLEITDEYKELFPGVDKTTYLPDFKNGHYYEVKGTFDGKGGIQSFSKLLMFMEQYPFKLDVIGVDEYTQLTKKFAEAINKDSRFCGWETLKDNIKTNPQKYS